MLIPTLGVGISRITKGVKKVKSYNKCSRKRHIIRNLLKTGHTQQQIINTLDQFHNFKVSRSTLCLFLRAENLLKKNTNDME